MSSSGLESKYQQLSKKIYHLQNIELKNPNKVDALDYDLSKIKEDMKKSIKDFEEKTGYIKSEISSIESIYRSKLQLQELNQNKIKTELENTEKNIITTISSHKEEMKNLIDETFSQIETDLKQMIENQAHNKEKVYEKIKKLIGLTSNQIPQLQNENDKLNKETRDNITNLRQILKEEFGYAYNLVRIII